MTSKADLQALAAFLQRIETAPGFGTLSAMAKQALLTAAATVFLQRQSTRDASGDL